MLRFDPLSSPITFNLAVGPGFSAIPVDGTAIVTFTWTKTYTVRNILTSIVSFFFGSTQPQVNGSSWENPDSGNIYDSDWNWIGWDSNWDNTDSSQNGRSGPVPVVTGGSDNGIFRQYLWGQAIDFTHFNDKP
jgi:hypothetical protein